MKKFGEMSFFISIEGFDGTGKSTQSKLLKDGLDKVNINSIVVREPGSTNFSEKIRKSEKIRPIAPRASSGQLGRARTGSAQLRTPKNRFLESKFFIAGMDGFRIADFGCF